MIARALYSGIFEQPLKRQIFGILMMGICHKAKDAIVLFVDVCEA